MPTLFRLTGRPPSPFSIIRRRFSLLLLLGWLAGPAHAAPPATPRPPTASAIGADTGPLLAGTRVLAIALGGFATILGVLLYLVPVRAVAATRRRIEADMSERAFSRQEEDRRRIARELHDGAGQALTAARLQLVALRDSGVEPVVVGQVIACIDEAMDEVRRSTSALLPPALAELGLAGALERHCESFGAACSLTIICEVSGRLPPLEAYLETACYRIAQEALHNAARHARAEHVWLRLEAADAELRLEIGDDGVGLTDAGTSGVGFDSIRERTRLVGGRLELSGSQSSGSRLTVAFPIRKGA